MSRELINIKQIDISKLNDVKIYDVLPEEVEGQVAYCTGDGKLYYGDGSEWKEISTGEVNPHDIILDTTNFDKNLDTTITDVQKLADAVDDLELGSLPSGTADGNTIKWDSSTSAWKENNSIQILPSGQNKALSIVFGEYTNGCNYGIHLEADLQYSVHINCVTGGYDMFRVYGDGKIFSNYLSGTGDRPVVADSDGNLKIGTASSTGRNYIEFLSDPLAAVSDAYAFSNTQLGLDGINLNDKVKMVQCYVIQADYSNVKNNELVMGHNIEDGQISVILNFNLAIGDRIKIYLEYIN